MALFEEMTDKKSKTFKEAAQEDIFGTFLNETEHADRHTVDGKECLVILEEDMLKEHAAHWEAGAKQNFDTGLYTARSILYVSVADYGPKPKVGKLLVLDRGTKLQRTYTIRSCEDEGGIYRIIMERTRQ